MRANDSSAATRTALAKRLRKVRQDIYGEAGSQALADALEIPLETWMNYEAGVVIPGVVLLKLQVLTSTTPSWLLTGLGEQYYHASRTFEGRFMMN